MARILDVYLHGREAGTLTQDDDANLSFTYADDYLTAQFPAISVAMPLREEPYGNGIARAYFSGLLPDEGARKRLAATLGVSHGNAFGLLEIIGGECAGALTLLPEGEALREATNNTPQLLSENKLIELLELLRSKPLLGGEQGVRLSLAGAQDKLAVCLVEGKIAMAAKAQPTTHILKPYIEGLEGTVENEIFCMQLARKLRLPAPTVTSGRAGDIEYFLIERYDRIVDKDGQITRLHQEDFCQALSVPPELKYEEEGGPGITQAQELIAQHSRNPAADRLSFLRMVIFHYLVGNADAHAKNFSLLYTQDVPDLAPVYDVLCTATYPHLTKGLAMKIDGRGIADTIHLKHWLTLVPGAKAAQRLLIKDLQEMSESIAAKSAELLSELQKEGVDHPVQHKVHEVIGKRVNHIQQIIRAVAS